MMRMPRRAAQLGAGTRPRARWLWRARSPLDKRRLPGLGPPYCALEVSVLVRVVLLLSKSDPHCQSIVKTELFLFNLGLPSPALPFLAAELTWVLWQSHYSGGNVSMYRGAARCGRSTIPHIRVLQDPTEGDSGVGIRL